MLFVGRLTNLSTLAKMPFPHTINFDRVAQNTLADLGTAVGGWLKGHPRDEVALMNRVTERLARRRRGCDVGTHVPVVMQSSLAILHRKGPKQVDRYGCDLAITVSIEDEDFIKTALFQFKKSTEYRCVLERAQLFDAVRDPRIGPRSFALAADEVRGAIRISPIATIVNAFDPTQKSKTFTVADWTCVTNWIQEWLSCGIGLPSDPNDVHSVEALLRAYTIDHERDLWDQDEAVFGADFPDDFLPARAWLKIVLTSRPSEL